MAFKLYVPRIAGGQLDFQIDVAEMVFVLGANGTGKSSLMLHFARMAGANGRRISAHRQTWMTTNTITFTPEQKRNYESNITSTDTSWESRWREEYAQQRSGMAIYDVIDAENVRARSIASAVDANDIDLAKTLSKADAPIKVINEILRLSNIPIEVAVEKNEQIFASKSGGKPYSVAELSDGERNALLLAANVLTAKAGTLFLIDEPERHLHRSIISPLLSSLLLRRSDCAFVVSTHEVMLPVDNPASRTMLVRSCQGMEHNNPRWDAELIQSKQPVDDAVLRDILGARKKILFVEGTPTSLDTSLYSLLFPDVSIVPKSSCHEVERATVGIRSAPELHWVKAYGLVDDDRRSSDDIARLKERGVYATPAFSVESIYYDPHLQRLVSERYSEVTGENAGNRTELAKKAAVAAIAPQVERFAMRIAEKRVRDEIVSALPGLDVVTQGQPFSIAVDIPKHIQAERTVIGQLFAAGDISALIARYPVRETSALDAIASNLGFKTRDLYEKAVRKLLLDDPEALEYLLRKFSSMISDMNALDQYTS